ncbi:class I SAM-dependent methyltransferase [Halobacteriovorax marinus]|uniref:class I SAM-dependent methyltransferase n=1 Tax=Halobacteriovorax marinus TaxID=97084 RepID=UPI003A8F279C
MKAIKKYFNNLFFLKNAPPIFEKTYQSMNKSKAYRDYCEKVHGTSFSCWNTLSPLQLNFLEEYFETKRPKSFLDIGSGNGELTKYLSKKYSAKATGIDFATMPNSSKEVEFIRDQFLNTSFNKKYEFIISNDSFYMITSYKKYLRKCLSLLENNSHMIILFSLVNEKFDKSPLRKALDSLQLNYEIKDFTADDYEFWKKSQSILEQTNQAFVDESQFSLWNIKKKETDKNIQLHNSNNIQRLGLVIQRG